MNLDVVAFDGKRPFGAERIQGCNAYIVFLAILIALATVLFGLWGWKGRDHFAAISLRSDTRWYKNYFDLTRYEIQDRDILYHNIGHSIENAQKSDIIILGHSMVLFGLDDDLVRQFEVKHSVKMFNLASAGDASGEFLLRIIKRWHLKPKLWVINADDHAGDFFSVSIDDFGNGGRSSAGHVLSYGRLQAFGNVVARNLRWRLEEIELRYLPPAVKARIFNPRLGSATWRSVVSGNTNYSGFPPTYARENPPITVARDQNCHASQQSIRDAQNYLRKIGGMSILTLFPHTDQCPQRVKEIAQSLDLDTVLPPDTNYTAWDNTHLDKRGAVSFTTFFLHSLETTREFQELLAKKQGKSEPPLPDLCFSNDTEEMLFFSLRDGDQTHDIALAPDQRSREKRRPYNFVCRSDKPFGRHECPSLVAAKTLACPP